MYKPVMAVLENIGVDYDFVSLHGKTIGGCIACLGCVKDKVCKVRDDHDRLQVTQNMQQRLMEMLQGAVWCFRTQFLFHKIAKNNRWFLNSGTGARVSYLA